MIFSCSSASRLPTQRWMPKPNERCVRGRGAVDDEVVGLLDHLSSRLPETYHMTTLSPFWMVLPPNSKSCERRAAHVGQRRLPADDLGHHAVDQRGVVAQLAVLRRDTGSARRTQPEIELRVVSLPPTISRMRLPRNSCVHVRASPRRAPASRSGRCFGGCVDALVPQSREIVDASVELGLRARPRSSTRPSVPGVVVATSDQRVSLRRSSNGKSNRVASICVVSSIETWSTQSNASPLGRLSRIGRRARGSSARDCSRLRRRARSG